MMHRIKIPYRRIVILILLLIAKLNFTSSFLWGPSVDISYNFTRELVFTKGYTLKWTHNPNSEWIYFEMSGITKGYLGLGFSSSGGMTHSDIYIGWVDAAGQGHLRDYFAFENGEPLEDHKQDGELLAASEHDNGTRIVFRRRFDTCDDKDFLINDDTTKLIWAWSDEDPVEHSRGRHIPYHSNDRSKRGVHNAFMRTRSIGNKFPDEEEIYPQNVTQIDFTVSNVKVPKAETYFHCKIFKFPRNAHMNNIIAHKPIIKLGSEATDQIVKINLYRCHTPKGKVNGEDVLDRFVDHPGQRCHAPDTPSEWTLYCHDLKISIGMGSEGEILPEDLAYRLNAYDKPVHYRLEIQYHNPRGKYLQDSSGIRLFYTSNIRKYEAGLLITGHIQTPLMSIPPYQQEFTVHGFCSADCTKQGLPIEGIKIVSVWLHSGKTLSKIVLRHIRNGKELTKIAEDSNPNYRYQQYRWLSNEVKILPGDILITECTYNTSKNETFIFGGLLAHETCQAYITFYPKIPLTNCASQPELKQYLGALSIANVTGDFSDHNPGPSSSSSYSNNGSKLLTLQDAALFEAMKSSMESFPDLLILSPKKLRNRRVLDYLSNLDWKDDYFAKVVERKWLNGNQYIYCSTSEGKRMLGSKGNIVPFPKYVELMDMKLQMQDRCWMKSRSQKMSANFKTILLSIIIILSINYYRNFTS